MKACVPKCQLLSFGKSKTEVTERGISVASRGKTEETPPQSDYNQIIVSVIVSFGGGGTFGALKRTAALSQDCSNRTFSTLCRVSAPIISVPSKSHSDGVIKKGLD